MLSAGNDLSCPPGLVVMDAPGTCPRDFWSLKTSIDVCAPPDTDLSEHPYRPTPLTRALLWVHQKL